MDTFIDRPRRGYVYLLTFGNGQVYVGRTRDFQKRLKRHEVLAAGCACLHCATCRQAHTKLYQGWREFGLVSAAVIFICRRTDTHEFERHFVSVYDSYRNGLNSTTGGKGRRVC
jgi:hypothetical protein